MRLLSYYSAGRHQWSIRFRQALAQCSFGTLNQNSLSEHEKGIAHQMEKRRVIEEKWEAANRLIDVANTAQSKFDEVLSFEGGWRSSATLLRLLLLHSPRQEAGWSSLSRKGIAYQWGSAIAMAIMLCGRCGVGGKKGGTWGTVRIEMVTYLFLINDKDTLNGDEYWRRNVYWLSRTPCMMHHLIWSSQNDC